MPHERSRRSFFRCCLAGALDWVEELMGRPQMLLSDLSGLPDEVIRSMVPVFNHERYALLDGGRIMPRGSDQAAPPAQPVRLLEQRGEYIAQHFDGTHTVEEIGRIAGHRFGLNDDEAYLAVKNLFIGLAEQAICRPLHAHDEHGEYATDGGK